MIEHSQTTRKEVSKKSDMRLVSGRGSAIAPKSFGTVRRNDQSAAADNDVPFRYPSNICNRFVPMPYMALGQRASSAKNAARVTTARPRFALAPTSFRKC